MFDAVPIEIAAALIAVLPSLATIYLARKLNELQARQNRHDQQTAEANYKLGLFHMRAEVFDAVQGYVSEFVTEGRPTVEAAVRLRRHGRNARFLFPPEVQTFVNELSARAFEYQRAYLLREPLRTKTAAGLALSDEEKAAAQARLDEMRAIEDWLTEIWESGRYSRIFAPFLTLPESLFHHPGGTSPKPPESHASA